MARGCREGYAFGRDCVRSYKLKDYKICLLPLGHDEIVKGRVISVVIIFHDDVVTA